MVNRGVVYCATDHRAYLEAALISAIVLRQLEPDLPITLISNHPLLQSLSLDDYRITPRFLLPKEVGANGQFVSRALKTRLIDLSPYQETLYIDADILPRQPIRDLWPYLEQADMGMVPDRLPAVGLCDHVSAEEIAYTLELVSPHTPHWNSGVMLWRNCAATRELFDLWHQEWQVFQKQDQLALVRALRISQLPIVKLPGTYNISPIDSAPLIAQGQSIHLLHCWGGMVMAGEHRLIAQKYYPEVVEIVDQLCLVCC